MAIIKVRDDVAKRTAHQALPYPRMAVWDVGLKAKVVAALEALGPADLPALLARVYDDVRPELHPVAARSLSAHLIKLRRDGRARIEGERWSALAAS